MTFSVSAVVGRNVRRLRADESQDAVAVRVRRFGPNWTRATIRAVEEGSAAVLVDELPAIAAALGASVLDLLDGAEGEIVTIGEGSASLDAVRAVFAQPARPAAAFPVLFGPEPASVEIAAGGKRLGAEQAAIVWRGRGGDAERKAAEKFNREAPRAWRVTPLDVSAASVRLWGRSLTDERERRVSGTASQDAAPRSLQAIRGRVTRELLIELEDHLEPTQVW